MEYKRIGITCRCGSEAFTGQFERQPRLDDLLSCSQCKVERTAEAWRRLTVRAAKRAARTAMPK